MDLDYGTVHGNRFYLDTHYVLSLKILENPVEHTVLGPPVHPGVDGVPVAKSRRQSPPFAALLGDIEDSVEYLQVRQADVATLNGKDRRNSLVLNFGDFHSRIVT